MLPVARCLSVAVLLTALAGGAAAQSLAEIAEQSKKQRKGTPAKVYRDEDLRKESRGSPAAPAATPPETQRPSRGSSDEASWKSRAASLRAAFRRAEARIPEIEARLNALTADLNPTANVMDPFRQQTLETEKGRVKKELEQAKEAVAQALKALEDFEEEARRKSIPPGWIREP